MNVSDAAVSAAIYAVQEACEGYDPGGWTEDRNWPIWTRQILEAAAPIIAAQALEDAANIFEDLPRNEGASISSGTWDWFELFPIEHMRHRAEDIRGGRI